MSNVDKQVPFFSEVQDASRNPFSKFGEKFFKIEGTRWGRTFVVDAGNNVREIKETKQGAIARNVLRLLGTITLIPLVIAFFSKLAHRANKQYSVITTPEGTTKEADKVAKTVLSEGSTALQGYLKQKYPDFANVKNARELQTMGHPLHFAVQQEDWQLLRLLIQDGADLSQKDDNGREALTPKALADFISVCTEADDAWLVANLSRWQDGALVAVAHAVVGNSNLKASKEYIYGLIRDRKMNVDASVNPERVQMSMLYKAAEKFDINTFIDLCKLNANVHLRNYLTGRNKALATGPSTPLACLVQRCPKDYTEILFRLLEEYSPNISPEIMHELLDNRALNRDQLFEFMKKHPGFDLNARDSQGLTALWKALGHQDYELVRWLLDNGANPKLQGDEKIADSSPAARADELLKFHNDPALFELRARL
ncbi:MAG: ankyrin repeat domain-containing protein [Verrucomicrobia bacterium]|nr:ankyrin repeat domain-containing protein [Verrucomicrobiota bacterium]